MSWQADRNDVPPGVREQITLLTYARIVGDDREAYDTDPALHPKITNFPDQAAMGRVFRGSVAPGVVGYQTHQCAGNAKQRPLPSPVAPMKGCKIQMLMQEESLNSKTARMGKNGHTA